MSRHYAKRADANQPALVEFLRHLGATFQHTHQIAGALDGIVGIAGIDQRVEIKDPEQPPSARKLTKKEQTTFNDWRGRKPVIIETDDDCLELIKTLRAEALWA